MKLAGANVSLLMHAATPLRLCWPVLACREIEKLKLEELTAEAALMEAVKMCAHALRITGICTICSSEASWLGCGAMWESR